MRPKTTHFADQMLCANARRHATHHADGIHAVAGDDIRTVFRMFGLQIDIEKMRALFHVCTLVRVMQCGPAGLGARTGCVMIMSSPSR